MEPKAHVTVTLFLPDGVTVNTYYKFIDNQWRNFTYDEATDTGAKFFDDDNDGDTDRIELHLVDNGRGDLYDYWGSITDPGGPAFRPGGPLEEDTILPSSRVQPLPAVATAPSFTVSWDGADNPGGSGLASFDVYVSDNGGPYQPLLSRTVLTSTVFTGQFGHTYAFYSVAHDTADNVEQKASADTQISFPVFQASLPTILEDTSTSPGMPIDQVLAGHYADTDPGARRGIAVIGTTGNGRWQYSLNNGSSWVPITSPSRSHALLLPDSARVHYRPAANENGSFDLVFLAWDRTTGAADQYVTVTSAGAGTSFSAAAGMVVAPVAPAQDAPSWSGRAATLTPILPGTTHPAGDTVANVFAKSFRDVDGDRVGIAVIGVTGTGTWQYSTDAGTSWTGFGSQATPFGIVSPGNALLLPDTDLLRFVPSAGFTGTATLTVDAWDGTQGTAAVAGATRGYKIAATGKATGFSSTTLVASLKVNAAATLASPTVEAWPRALSAGATSPAVRVATLLGEAGASADATGIALLGAPNLGGGAWQYSLDHGRHWKAVPAVAAASALLLPGTAQLRFRSVPGAGGQATLAFRAWDGTAGVAGSLFDEPPRASKSSQRPRPQPRRGFPRRRLRHSRPRKKKFRPFWVEKAIVRHGRSI